MSAENKFSQAFQAYVCEGDTITYSDKYFDVTATIRRDDCADTPEQRDDFFNPKKEQFETPHEYDAACRKAKAVRDAWERDEWFYCGVVLSVARNGVELAKHAASLWGIECNYPGSDNAYLTEVANELLPEALAEAKNVLTKLAA